jgi:4-hydroxy-3-polyprenylbenzoate decarboxylase
MYDSLGRFIDALEVAGELQRVSAEVSPILEISEVADRHSKSACANRSMFAHAFDPDHAGLGGKALLFERVTSCDFPVAINVFGSYRRMEMALGCERTGGFEAIARRIAALTMLEPPKSLRGVISKAKQMMPLLRVGPKRVRRGACQEVVKLTERGEVDLTRLPIIKCWPLDGDPQKVGWPVSMEQAGTDAGQGRYITFAGIHTIHARDASANKPASHNIGMYRAQLVDATHLVMHWHMHHDGAAHWRSWKRAGKPMPIAICFGGEAVLPYAATAPLPPGMSELLIAGFLNGRGIPMVRAKTVPLWVPANSEIVIEGYVSTESGSIGWDPAPASGEPLGPGAALEGPFGDHTGYYSLPDRYPIVDVTAITHRHNAIYPTTIVGIPPQEDYYMGKATERIFLPLLRTLIPDIVDYHLPMFGCFHNCAFIRIRKEYPLHARRVMHAIWGAGQMAWTKLIVVVEEDVDVHDGAGVCSAMFENVNFGRDLEVVHGPLDILDHAAPRLGAGGKLGIDATRKIVGEEVGGIAVSNLKAEIDGSSAASGSAAQRLERLFAEESSVARVHVPEFSRNRLAIIQVNKEDPGDGAGAIDAVFASEAGRGIDLIIAVSDAADIADFEQVMFHCCANMDPSRDLYHDGERVGIDATRKLPGPGDEHDGEPVRDYPPLIVMDEEIRRHVEERAADFGLAGI